MSTNSYKVPTTAFVLLFTLLCSAYVPEAQCDVVFAKNVNNPLISAGFSGGAFDAYGVSYPAIIYDANESVYKMWYTGWSVPTIRGQIGYATSLDGYSWIPYQSNPVIGFGFTGGYDSWHATRPVVIKDGSTYKMWYSGDSYGHFYTCYATSNDGVNWTSHGMIIDWTEVFGSSAGWARYTAPSTVLKEDGIYKMWYYTACCDNSGVGYATSTDGINWTVYGEVMGTGLNGEWDGVYINYPCVVKYGLDYLMFYTGCDDGVRHIERIGLATSPDGIEWTKYDNNPVLNLGSPGAWDERMATYPFVLIEEDVIRMWYSGNGPNYLAIGYAMSDFGAEQPGSIAGRVTADCPDPITGLSGVSIDAFAQGNGDLAGTAVTDPHGYYQIDSLAKGEYTVTVVTPLGYSITSEDILVTVEGGDIVTADFELTCEEITASPRKMSFWKHQVGMAIRGKGNAEVDGLTICSYLDLIEEHFNSNEINQVIVYLSPPSGECADKLQVAKDLLNLKGDNDMASKAKQQLMALLLNVASAKLSMSKIISPDGATVSQAITYVDHIIDDGDGKNDNLARDIAKRLNKGQTVDSGIIPLTTDDIAYSPQADNEDLPRRFSLGQSYPNPFNPRMQFEYALDQEASVVLSIHDVSGRLVRTLVSSPISPGTYSEEWDGRDSNGREVTSGVYFYRLKAGKRTLTRKAILLK